MEPRKNHMRPVRLVYGPNFRVTLIDIESGEEISACQRAVVNASNKEYLTATIDMNISEVDGQCNAIARCNESRKNGV